MLIYHQLYVADSTADIHFARLSFILSVDGCYSLYKPFTTLKVEIFMSSFCSEDMQIIEIINKFNFICLKLTSYNSVGCLVHYNNKVITQNPLNFSRNFNFLTIFSTRWGLKPCDQHNMHFLIQLIVFVLDFSTKKKQTQKKLSILQSRYINSRFLNSQTNSLRGARLTCIIYRVVYIIKVQMKCFSITEFERAAKSPFAVSVYLS